MANATESGRKKSAACIEIEVAEPAGLMEFLLSKLTNKSRNNVKALLTNREVTVDGHIVTKYDYPLEKGQKVRIVRSVCRGEKPQNQIQILYEDSDLIVINKPAGLLTVATDNERQRTAYNAITEYVRQVRRGERIFVVHRLDRETSGVLLFAKNEKIKLALQDNWNSLVLLRGYVAVTEGRMAEKSGRVRSWLRQTNSLRVYSDHNEDSGLEAITNYQVIGEGAKYSLVNIQLETGRKNQIRVHMKELGHPVTGDKKYGAKSNPIKRVALHANKLELIHPFTHKHMCFEAETPAEFKALLNRKR